MHDDQLSFICADLGARLGHKFVTEKLSPCIDCAFLKIYGQCSIDYYRDWVMFEAQAKCNNAGPCRRSSSKLQGQSLEINRVIERALINHPHHINEARLIPMMVDSFHKEVKRESDKRRTASYFDSRMSAIKGKSVDHIIWDEWDEIAKLDLFGAQGSEHYVRKEDPPKSSKEGRPSFRPEIKDEDSVPCW